MDSKLQCYESNTGMCNLHEQNIKLFEDNEELIDSRSVEDISDESVDLKKSKELFSDTTNSNIQSMHFQKSNIDMYNIENVQLCEDDNNFVIKNGRLDMNHIQESTLADRRLVDVGTQTDESRIRESVESLPAAESLLNVTHTKKDSRIEWQRNKEKNNSTCNENVDSEHSDDSVPYFVIEKTPLDVNCIKNNLFEGRRIFDFSFIWTAQNL